MNVFNEIKDLLIFESEDDFYYLQILQRKKENPQLGSNSRVIKNYFINNLEYLEKKMPEIIEICDLFNARAMLRLNKRSYKKVAFKAMINMANSMGNGEFKFTGKSYDRAVGQGHNDKIKKWIIDIDEEHDELWWADVRKYINFTQPIGDKIIKKLKTKNGFHLITTHFNLQKFKEEYPEIDIHKDNPINLYIPLNKHKL